MQLHALVVLENIVYYEIKLYSFSSIMFSFVFFNYFILLFKELYF